jgi:hypothetical protein
MTSKRPVRKRPAQRWRTLHWLPPFGRVGRSVRRVREKSSGRYLTRSNVLLHHQATRLLASAPEQEAGAATSEQNDRPAARSPAGLTTHCQRFHGTHGGPDDSRAREDIFKESRPRRNSLVYSRQAARYLVGRSIRQP